MNTKLESMSISPAKNGGFSVRHNFKPKAQYATGKGGGFSPGMPTSEEHVFGPDQHAELVAHIAKNLGLSEAREEEAEVGGRTARSKGMRAARQEEAEVSGKE